MEQKKGLLNAIVFLVLLFGLGIAQLCLPDRALSQAERRKLAQAPELSSEKILSGAFSQELESYLLDQFPLRERFRTLNAMLRFYVFRQQNSEGIYIQNGVAFAQDDPLSEKQIRLTAEKIETLCATYLQNCSVYYAVIPGKTAFAGGNVPCMDYGRLRELLEQSVRSAKQVDIWNLLSVEDYYRTDLHWRQERIYPVAMALAEAMGVGQDMTPESAYETKELFPFYGVYYGQAALPMEPDTLCYQSSEQTERAIVTGLEFQDSRPVYATWLFDGMDGYDVFLSGAQAVVTVELPDAKTERELIIFRDSFSSAIAPYFLGAYRKITLIDLRYISTELLEDYVRFDKQDVLFLYFTTMINRGGLLK